MTSLPKKPKPNYEKSKNGFSLFNSPGTVDVKKIISEMTEIIKKNKKLEKEYKKNEVAFGY
ncbi:MAG: hypothetical protein G01um101416_876 [Microgenomates group bacterium Gr01-1014_16]|nr:MAG: hypothetical protein G01um101416_876 [Microgenomates group bacterium Gr01-1014_16]